MKKNSILYKTRFPQLLFFFVLLSCSGPENKTGYSDNGPSREVKMIVDESYTLLFDTEIYMFESFYKNAKVHIRYAPENISLQALLDDSAKVAVINRDLRPAEKEAFKSRNLFPRTIKIAEDAIAFVIHKDNPDSIFSIDKLRSIFEGKDTLWSQINKKSRSGKIEIVFDNPGSANARYLKDSLLKGKNFPKNCFAVNSNPEVIKYVKQHKNALGVISVNWISDRDDTLSRRFLNEIKVAGIARAEGERAYKPYQAYIKTKEYPFCRDVYIINRQTHSGLGMSFVGFITGEKGQRIILKAGLIPATAPVRIVKINPGS